MSRPSTISTSDMRILKALEPFAAGYAVLVSPPNFICGSNRKYMAWFFEAESDCPFPECRSIPWGWLQDGMVSEASTSVNGMRLVERLRRTIGPDIDVDIVGEWYIPRTVRVPEVDYVYFGFSGVYQIDQEGGTLGTLNAPPVSFAASEPLVIPAGQLKEIHDWFGKHGLGNTSLRWLRMPEYDRAVLQARCVVDKDTMLTFVVSGMQDSKFDELEGWL